MGATSGTGDTRVTITLQPAPERHLIHPIPSFRHVVFHIQVGQAPARVKADRQPLTLALVLDRSGSMQGEKIVMAKRAALAVLDRLDERDQAAVVIFDDRIDVAQPLGAATTTFKAQVRATLAGVDARANTALHEGWLTGCKAIAPEELAGKGRNLSRCFLLTDGLANVGVTDPEQIAGEAAGIREHTSISTSTFGIGDDYNEGLLGPMAVAGGGQFHHLRTANEMLDTFVGELGDLLAVAARQVRLEVQGEPGMSADVVSAYWTKAPQPEASQWSIAIGDLLSGEERHVVVRFGFPAQQGQDGRTIRARLVWADEDGERSAEWQELRFYYAAPQSCDAEPLDPAVMRQVGVQQSNRAQREALELNRRGDLAGAGKLTSTAAASIQSYAGDDEQLQREVEELQSLTPQVASSPVPTEVAKEHLFRKQSESRGQKDYRSKSDK